MNDLASVSQSLLVVLEQLEVVHGNYVKELDNIKRIYETVDIAPVYCNLLKSCLRELPSQIHESSKVYKDKILKFNSCEKVDEYEVVLKDLFLELEKFTVSRTVKEIRDFDFKISKDLMGVKKKPSLIRTLSRLLKRPKLSSPKTMAVTDHVVVKDDSKRETEQEREVDEEGYTIPKVRLEESNSLEEKKLEIKINEKKENGRDLDLVNAVSSLRMTLERKRISSKEITGLVKEESISKVSDPFIANYGSKDMIQEKVVLKFNREINALVDGGKVKKLNSGGQIILQVPNSWDRKKNVVLEFQDLFEELLPLSDFIKVSNDSRMAEIDLSELPLDISEIPIFKFTLKSLDFYMPVQVLHTIWKKESKSLMMLFAYRCQGEVTGLKIEAFISFDENDKSLKTQSKPEGVWNQHGKCMVWNFSNFENTKVLAKFDASSALSAGIINLSYYWVSVDPSISVNGENTSTNSVVAFKCVCA